jgi:uroporphyrin-III C-methyltransferase
VRAARRYAVVVRLKGGDPMLFARAQEEIDACAAARVAVEITPGVSAAFAAAADFNASLTQRGVSRSVAFVTPAVGRGEQGDDHWAKAAAAADTAVVYMGSQDAAGVRSALLAAGVPATRPAAFIERAGGDAPRILPGSVAELPTMAEGLGDGPALLVIGAVLSAATAQALAHIGQAA